ncbi:MAG: type III-B CRISPR-associated protein Cas10/Cmr2 [Verrucomicrobiales bacterium]|nr:type III-B CRISPR-associated protein Cas10/Cmr2 [Verrucomicrobiales bacterium]
MTDFWKRKLAAYLHDPPSKCLDIANHRQQSERAMQAAGLGTPEERKAWDHIADHTAAAADRFPFPDHQKASQRCAFDGVKNQFHHPLSGDKLAFDGPFLDPGEGIEGEQTTQPVLNHFGDLPEAEQWRARFLAHWRLWPGACQKKDWRLGFLPADTRIPDHAIWPHMQMVAAFEGALGDSGNSRPALLKFQLGPVQDFIQAARSTRDLWSGSYLLSWLMAHGLAKLSLDCGPDAVVFPNLRDQPLLDLVLKNAVWEKVTIGERPVWQGHDAMKWSQEQLLTPNLPNVLLALVPEDQARQLAEAVEKGVRDEWRTIARSVWEACTASDLWNHNTDLPQGESLKSRWNDQVEQFLSIAWSVTPIPSTLAEIEALHGAVPAPKTRERYHAVKKAAEAIRELGHGDDRYFTKDGKLKNEGLAWSLAVSLASWELDAVRQTRVFRARSQPGPDAQRQGQHFDKDSLTGKDEAVAGGEPWSNATVKNAKGRDVSRFKHADFLSAPSLIKRLWDITYLEKEWSLARQKMPNTRSLAAGRPDQDDADDELPAGEGERYFAVLAFDGDDMGKWVAGDRTPTFATQLADYEGGGALEYFKRPAHAGEFAAFLETHRPLSPGYHLQFSECLSNFALRCARSIVEANDGRLIYAGGDDVVALLPADTALACARELRNAFRGEVLSTVHDHRLRQKSPGFLTSKDHQGDGGVEIPFAVPGPKASASVGIAIAHFKSPLQDAVRAAQSAEKRAKILQDKDAVAVTVLKRSGETVEWSARWAEGGVDAAQCLLEALKGEVVSSKFPYRLGELISNYRSQPAPIAAESEPVPGFDFAEVVGRELRTVLDRQRGPEWKAGGAAFEQAFGQHLRNWLGKLNLGADAANLDHAINQLVALCAFCGFAKRQDTSLT